MSNGNNGKGINGVNGWLVNANGFSSPNFSSMGSVPIDANEGGFSAPIFENKGDVPNNNEYVGCNACGQAPDIDIKNDLEELEAIKGAATSLVTHIHGLTRGLAEGKLNLSDAIKAVEDLSRANVASAGDLIKMAKLAGIAKEQQEPVEEPVGEPVEEPVKEPVEEEFDPRSPSGMIDTLIPTDENLIITRATVIAGLDKEFEGGAKPHIPRYESMKRYARENVIPELLDMSVKRVTLSNPIRISRLGKTDKARARTAQELAENIVHVAANLVRPEEYPLLVNSFAKRLNEMVGENKDVEFTISRGGLVHAMMSARVAWVLPEDYLTYNRAREIFFKQLAPRLPKSMERYLTQVPDSVHYELYRYLTELIMISAYEIVNDSWCNHNKIPYEVLEEAHPTMHKIEVEDGIPQSAEEIPEMIRDAMEGFANFIRNGQHPRKAKVN